MEYLQAFLVGGILCLIGQILIDKNQPDSRPDFGELCGGGRPPLGALGIYEPIVQFGGRRCDSAPTGFGQQPTAVKQGGTERLPREFLADWKAGSRGVLRWPSWRSL